MAATKPKPLAGPTPAYEVVGLQKAESMPITFGDRSYDLANLSAEDAAYLMQFPEQVPYLKPLTQNSQLADA